MSLVTYSDRNLGFTITAEEIRSSYTQARATSWKFRRSPQINCVSLITSIRSITHQSNRKSIININLDLYPCFAFTNLELKML